MRTYPNFYIDGRWVAPADPAASSLDVIDPATESVAGSIRLGDATDVDHAVAAARSAFAGWSQSTPQDRLEILRAITAEFKRRYDDVADAIMTEMGAPLNLARGTQTAIGLSHLDATITALGGYSFDVLRGTTRIVQEPIGVCGFITPWNWPINQIVCKVAPAIACGCTMVLKPSELAPFSAMVWTEICDAAGLPAGVFNLVNGTGPEVGHAIASHKDVDMVSFTGSTGAGINVAIAAAPTVKRVHQELGGKSAHIVLDDDGFEGNVRWNVRAVALNAGQNCNAPTRLLVPQSRMADAARLAGEEGNSLKVGHPTQNPDVGPVISDVHWHRIQGLLEAGVTEGAQIVCGGPGHPHEGEGGYFVKPTVFSHVSNDMRIAREEIFGPVLVIIPYHDLDDAVAIANDSPFGLAAYVSGQCHDTLKALSRNLRAGQVNINGAPADYMAPFGGYKMSGNGREWGDHALAEFLETKAVIGFETPQAA